MGFRYGSIDHYRALAAIERAVLELGDRGIAPEDRPCYRRLLDMVRTEVRAASIRAANDKAESIKRQRPDIKEVPSAG